MDQLCSIEKIRQFNRHYANFLGRVDQDIYNQPLPLTEARVITEIHFREGCTATEIRENLGIDRGYMSRIIRKLEEDKLIMKEQSPFDKRRHHLYLTAQGEDVYNRLVTDANVGVSRMIQGIPERDLSKLLNSMETIENVFLNENTQHNKVSIRSFKPGDLGYVAHLHGKYYNENYNFGSMFEYYVMKGLTEFMADSAGGGLWVAEVNGEIAGSIAITKSNSTVAQLRWFILDENYQGMGIGKKLMETAVNYCKEQGFQHVFLWTVSILDAARHLYQKFDFTLSEEKTNEAWTGTKLVEERWDLDISETKENI
ncbi:helix-turn-helix domain-containing GNAT family N-acetyltransferase [Halobacillus sp. A5]|uniref:bifunctional helix-turn-helix transcriptional regulator/GNAT family N-acetyltransferase n=1 Tax=Halobacillus sp. A5 TaxID=2880263 RepID=UPI0020A69814|nr:helix-turn-helix domain-containing GNAT family N-acetyltransferase [Halobacillus sp. A5]MCP3027351.1 helix-turn-helix domain-containing GNAT family N-acetyltransferase [Halobacillus sp. A5]